MPRREFSPTEPGLPIGLQIDQRRQRPFVAIRLLARCFATALSAHETGLSASAKNAETQPELLSVR